MERLAVTIRLAEAADYGRAAALRWRWTTDEMGAAPPIRAEEFSAAFVAWARAHRDTHAVFLAFRGSDAIGMAWVGLAARVPSPGSLDRTNAEVMSVYVLPDERDLGVGTLLTEAAVAWAADAGAEHAIVHSSERAIGLYERSGFGVSPIVLDQDLSKRRRIPPISDR